MYLHFFFFSSRRRHTRFKCDWSSDVCSSDLPPGSIVALLGTNGAGKTTTLRAISGFLGADDAQIVGGRVVFQGASVTGRPPHELARRGLVLVPARNTVFETLTDRKSVV